MVARVARDTEFSLLYRSGHTRLRVCPVNALCPVKSWQLFPCPQEFVTSLLGQRVPGTLHQLRGARCAAQQHISNQPVVST